MKQIALLCLLLCSTLTMAQLPALQPDESWEGIKASCMKNQKIQKHLDTFGLILIRYHIKISKKGKINYIKTLDSSDLSGIIISEITNVLKMANWKIETKKHRKEGLEFIFHLEKASSLCDFLAESSLKSKYVYDSLNDNNVKIIILPNGDSVKMLIGSTILPRYPGGDGAFIEVLLNLLEYPRKCETEGISGFVQFSFTVDIYGNIKNIEIEKDSGTCPEFGAEAERVLKLTGKWIPSTFGGHYIEMKRSLPISININ